MVDWWTWAVTCSTVLLGLAAALVLLRRRPPEPLSVDSAIASYQRAKQQLLQCDGSDAEAMRRAEQSVVDARALLLVYQREITELATGGHPDTKHQIRVCQYNILADGPRYALGSKHSYCDPVHREWSSRYPR